MSHNNAVGIMQWDKGYRGLKRYESCEESLEDFKRIWREHYRVYPNWYLADKWTGGDSVGTWLAAVNKIYSDL